jgi:hypothetical protein
VRSLLWVSREITHALNESLWRNHDNDTGAFGASNLNGATPEKHLPTEEAAACYGKKYEEAQSCVFDFYR